LNRQGSIRGQDQRKCCWRGEIAPTVNGTRYLAGGLQSGKVKGQSAPENQTALDALCGPQRRSLELALAHKLLEELATTDAQGALLLEAYLDRHWVGWRERRSCDASRDEPRPPSDPKGRMTIQEAQ
jgi:hypothetical protein